MRWSWREQTPSWRQAFDPVLRVIRSGAGFGNLRRKKARERFAKIALIRVTKTAGSALRPLVHNDSARGILPCKPRAGSQSAGSWSNRPTGLPPTRPAGLSRINSGRQEIQTHDPVSGDRRTGIADAAPDRLLHAGRA